MYKSKLTIRQTQEAIQDLRHIFQEHLKKNLNLTRATAPLFVAPESGLNDGLNGESAVSFEAKMVNNKRLEVVHSLAKWKRNALKEYDYKVGEGIYTDMNAIRREEVLDETHSLYVDQWDWEKIITSDDRNINFLKEVVSLIYDAFKKTKREMVERFSSLENDLPEEVFFISAQDLEDLYPESSIDERENLITQKHKVVFIKRIGYPLKSGLIHSTRAFDYDDWKLNGDLLVWSNTLKKAVEISSMGIRVDEKSLKEQSKMTEAQLKELSPYHKAIIDKNLPLTIGGGIGQSRVCMLILEKAHIGEVQSSYWPEDYKKKLKAKGINLL
ncbi:aspartate--ammonia ligase [Mycoplasma procyoni]|uniref:aspartate--ammonia ligase n=1 Tax=Mycoplasma procyoni TaxID=568784 RepID=UPI00197CB4D4|nr:aspartate--ammonia ligase [Mycoplasma procyoni]MBN3534865.1 aspartate--ammonia ligase [Mycoplasma procyoni]